MRHNKDFAKPKTLEEYRLLNPLEKWDFSELDSDIKTILVQGDLSLKPAKYSILIPTCNNLKNIKRSLKYALRQRNFADYEIIILERDSNPKSDVIKYLKKFKNNKKIFVYQAEEDLHGWNRLVRLTRTPWFTLCCDDDYLLPDFLQVMDKILTCYPKIDALASRYDFFGSDINVNPLHKYKKDKIKYFKAFLREQGLFPPSKRTNFVKPYILENFYTRNFSVAPNCVVYNTEKFRKLGYWTKLYQGCNDTITNLNYMLNNNIYYTNQILGKKHAGEGNASNLNYYKKQFVYLIYLTLMYPELRAKLKYIKFDDWFIQSVALYIGFVEGGLKFDEISEMKELRQEYYTKENMELFLTKLKEYNAQIDEIVKPICQYKFNIQNKIEITEEV